MLDLRYTLYDNEADFEEEDKKLISQARVACESSYSPYSHFQVGSAILLSTQHIITGSNQENAAYPSGLCAERVALFHAGANYSNEVIRKLALTAKKQADTIFVPVTPCGSCRQVLLEYEMKQNSSIEIIMQINDYQWVKTKSAKVLLPFCFNKDSL